jgi:hypothetical protein
MFLFWSLVINYAYAGNCPGVCQQKTTSCPSAYLSGLCPGDSSYACCPQATPQCSSSNHQCQINKLPCAGSYVSGLCPGSTSTQCCVSPTSGNGDSAWYYKNWCGHPGALQYLDDGLCAKVFPSNFTRDFKCPNVYQTIPSTYSKDLVASLPERNNWVNESAFTNIPYANQVELAMILVKRDLNGRPYFHYVSNGRQANAYETWSSSKVFVVQKAIFPNNPNFF